MGVPHPTTRTDAKFNVNLVGCLQMYYWPTDDECEKLHCDYCNMQNIFEWDTCLRQLPELLVITIKRFKYNKVTKRIKRRAFRVGFPQVLDMQPYCNSCLLGTAPLLYDLVAVLHHNGTAKQGHYTADAVRGGVWVNFNDHQTNFNVSASVESNSAYMLFYKAWPLTPMTPPAWAIMTHEERRLYLRAREARKALTR